VHEIKKEEWLVGSTAVKGKKRITEDKPGRQSPERKVFVNAGKQKGGKPDLKKRKKGHSRRNKGIVERHLKRGMGRSLAEEKKKRLKKKLLDMR